MSTYDFSEDCESYIPGVTAFEISGASAGRSSSVPDGIVDIRMYRRPNGRTDCIPLETRPLLKPSEAV